MLAARSNGQAARERRTVLEREANRALDTVPAVARRLVTLAEGLDREYTTVFAMAGRNPAAAALHRERAAERRKEAEFIVARLRVWMARPVEGSSDGELEALVRATDGFRVRLEEPGRVGRMGYRRPEICRGTDPAAPRASAQGARADWAVVGDQRRPPLRSLSRAAPRHMRRSLALI